jgi:hypothetical protein
MHQSAIMEAWRKALVSCGFTTVGKAQAFFDMLSARSEVCWGPELATEFRRHYYDAFDEIVSALFATDDPLIIYQCLQHADFTKPKEVEAFQEFIRNCDPEKHQVILRELAETQVPELRKAVKAKKHLPDSVREALVHP